MTIHFDDATDVFWGQTSPNLATVYVRVRGLGDGSLSLRGSVYGPHCSGVRTLPFRVPLNDLGPGETLLARAAIPDPCFWSPALPFCYRVEIELARDGQVLGRCERPLGIRSFGAAGDDLRWEGKRWVARGARFPRLQHPSLASLHDASLVAVTPAPDDPTCQAASELGVLIFAMLAGDSEAIQREVVRLARWPAVAMVIVPADAELPRSIHDAGANLLFAASCRATAAVQPPAWASALWIELDETLEDIRKHLHHRLPILVARTAAASESAASLREACDRLQADLAPIGQFAGYMVKVE